MNHGRRVEIKAFQRPIVISKDYDPGCFADVKTPPEVYNVIHLCPFSLLNCCIRTCDSGVKASLGGRNFVSRQLR